MSPYDLLYSLLRLACKSSNGYLPERQNALEKAIAHAQKHRINLQVAIRELRIDLDGLRYSFAEQPTRERPPRFYRAPWHHSSSPRVKIDGVYPVAGFQYYEGPRLRNVFEIGQAVSLQALTTNPFDRFAVAIFYRNVMIGYIPRERNRRIWRWLRDGGLINAFISAIHDFDGYGAIEVTLTKGAYGRLHPPARAAVDGTVRKLSPLSRLLRGAKRS